jgi:plastocyanin domain-containing protein
MKIKTSTSLVIAGLIIVGAWYVVGGRSDSTRKNPIIDTTVVSTSTSIINNGVQYITITARGGYQPRFSIAKAGVPTKLIMKTDGSYDCSTSLVIRSLNYRNILPSTGETVIDAGTPKVGDTLQGVCSMGMYSFVINFK